MKILEELEFEEEGEILNIVDERLTKNGIILHVDLEGYFHIVGLAEKLSLDDVKETLILIYEHIGNEAPFRAYHCSAIVT